MGRASLITIIALVLIAWWAVRCQSSYTTMPLNSRLHALPELERDYHNFAWYDEEQLALIYGPQHVLTNVRDRLGLYSLSTREWQELPMPELPDECFSGWLPGILARLPNGELGSPYTCALESIGLQSSLYVWDPQQRTIELRSPYPERFAPGTFSFSPDMSVFIQEEVSNIGMTNELYRITWEGEVERLLPHFQRAGKPDWSPDGETVAFFGTETYPGAKPDDVQTWGAIEGLLRYPWDLYFMDPLGQDVRLVLKGIHDPSRLRWSPSGNKLALTGILDGKRALWLFIPESGELLYLWPEVFQFDWSPDGQHIIFFESEGEELPHNLRILDIPH